MWLRRPSPPARNTSSRPSWFSMALTGTVGNDPPSDGGSDPAEGELGDCQMCLSCPPAATPNTSSRPSLLRASGPVAAKAVPVDFTVYLLCRLCACWRIHGSHGYTLSPGQPVGRVS